MTARELKAKVDASPLKQWEIAKQLGMDQATFSRILNGVTPLPEAFEVELQRAMVAVAEEKAEQLIASVAAPFGLDPAFDDEYLAERDPVDERDVPAEVAA